MMKNKLLTAEEVAEYLRVDKNTIYIWCRNGHLPGIKIGKEWRIRTEDLDVFLSAGRAARRTSDLVSPIWGNINPTEHLLIVANSPDNVWELEVSFFKAALEKEIPLFKGCWWQSPEEVKQRYAEAGLPVSELVNNGKLIIYNFWEAYQRGGPQEVIDLWKRRSQDGYFWGSGSHLLAEWSGNDHALVDFEEGLHQAMHNANAVAICPIIPTSGDKNSYTTVMRLTRHHSGTVLLLDTDDPILLRQSQP
jgi:excisionase family DNA binding protein